MPPPTDDWTVRLPWDLDPAEKAARLVKHEWLVTNGLGGYASGTLAGVASRSISHERRDSDAGSAAGCAEPGRDAVLASGRPVGWCGAGTGMVVRERDRELHLTAREEFGD